MARREGALIESREGLGGSPAQVVGQRPAVEPALLGSPWESSRLADRVVVATMGGQQNPPGAKDPWAEVVVLPTRGRLVDHASR